MRRIKSSVVSMAAYAALLAFIFAGGVGAANCPPDDEVNLSWTLKPSYVRSGDTVYFEVTTDVYDGGTYTWLCSRSDLGTFTPNGNSAMFETLPDRVREIFTIYCTYSFEDSDQENICSYYLERSYALCGADMLVDSNYDRYKNLSDNATEVSQGGIVVLNNDDDNTNGVPDYNDTGFWDHDFCTVYMPFIPYGAGGVVTLTQTSGQGKVKVYSTDNPRREINMSVPKTWTWPDQIFPSYLYIEGIQRSSSRGDVAFTVTWTKESYSEFDTIRLTVLEADLDVDSNHDGGISDTDEATEVSAGGIVPLGGVAPINIALRPVKPSGGGTLTLDAPLGKTNIKVWMNPDKTSLVTLPASWALDSAPPTLYVEGYAASSSMRDVELSLLYNAPAYDNKMNQKDTIKMTVVDVDLAVDSNNDGYIWSDDNEIEDNSGTLGLLICKNDDHDNGYQGLPDCDDEVLVNYQDFLDCGIMELSLMPSGLPNGSVVELSVNDSSKVRIFRYAEDPYQPDPHYTPGWNAIIGPSRGSIWTRTLSAAPYPSLEYFLIEGVNPGLVEITVIYKIPNGSGGFIEVARDKVRATVINIDLKGVSFGGTNYHPVRMDDDSQSYIAPHWEDNSTPLNGSADDPGDKKYPICFTRNSKMKVSATWIIEPSGLGLTVKVKGDGPGNLDFPATTATISGNDLTITDVECSNPFVNEVDFFDPMSIAWSFSVDGGSTWCAAGTSANQTYVTFGDPDTGTTLFQTLVHLGCKNADGENTATNCTSKIWTEFTDRDVRRVDGVQLTYYASYTCGNVTTASLLANGDGQCGSWASLFIDMRKVQGIDDTDEYVIFRPIPPSGIPQDYVGFLVKNWTFSGSGSSGHATHPYLNLPDSPFIGAMSYNWKFAEVTDATGIPGQSNANPASFFNNHQVVISGEYYDPSYGIKYNSLQDIDDNSIAGYYIGPVAYPVDEPAVNLDLNGDGDKTDLQVDTGVYLMQKNAAGLDIWEERYNW